jgi:hypothetical protein
MNTEPCFDRDRIRQVTREAKEQRTRELRAVARLALGVLRWGGLSGLVAFGLTFAGSQPAHAGPVAGPAGDGGTAAQSD